MAVISMPTYSTVTLRLGVCNPKGVSGGTGGATGPSAGVLELAVDVMDGKYGVGNERKQRLGSRYDEVQGLINHIASASVETLAKEVIAGKYGNGEQRRKVLGARYDEVQARVNQIA